MRTLASRLKADRSGFSLMETALFGSLSAMISLMLVPYLSKPSAIGRMVGSVDAQTQALRAGRLIENDLLEASPASIDLTTIPPQNPGNLSNLLFQKIDYDLATPTMTVTHTIQYAFSPDATGASGALTRSLDGAPATVVLDHLIAPTAANPLFQSDPLMSRMLILSFTYQPLSSNPIPFVQRIAMRG